MADLIKTTVDSKTLEQLKKDTASSESAYPKLTKAVIESAITHLKDLKQNRGYGSIAANIGFDKIHKTQVKEIHAAMLKRIASLEEPKKL